MAKLDLTKYGITGTTEVVYNPSYEQLFAEETKPGLEGYEKGQVSELGAVNVMTASTLVVLPRISSSSWTRTPRTPCGGPATSTRMTTTPLLRKHGLL